MGPAGGMFSTVGDLARLVRAELNGGLRGVTTQTQKFRVPQRRTWDSVADFGWGLGWDLGTFDGDTLVHRFGTFPGYGCHVSFMRFRKGKPAFSISAMRAGRSDTCSTTRFQPPGSCFRPSGRSRDPEAPGPLKMSFKGPNETWPNAGRCCRSSWKPSRFV